MWRLSAVGSNPKQIQKLNILETKITIYCDFLLSIYCATSNLKNLGGSVRKDAQLHNSIVRSVGIGKPSPTSIFCKINLRGIEAKKQGVYHCQDYLEFVITGFMVPVLCSREDHYNEILLLKMQTMAHFTCKQPKVKVITTKNSGYCN